MRTIILFISIFIFSISSLQSQTVLFQFGASWKYLDNGSNQGTNWKNTAFNDAAWASGNGQLGYGDGDETTIVSYGPNANSKFITTYFRKTISITNPSLYSAFNAQIKRDDGVVVYINGTEVFRNNMPAGAITHTTLASSSASDDGATPQPFSIATNLLTAGNNVIAVEIHQNAVTSSDLSFDMELTATPQAVYTTLLPLGSNWKYNDKGVNLGSLWRNLTYNDATWLSGNAQLGYGDGDEATLVSYGTDTANRYMTTYFRKVFSIADTTQFAGYHLALKRDDGAVVYINGKEVFRSNMPDGSLAFSSRASSDAVDDGNGIYFKNITLSNLKQGSNVIAVEVHQYIKNSPDLSFDLELKAYNYGAAGNATLIRGPYMNSALQNSIVIRWRTNVPTNTIVNYSTTSTLLTTCYIDSALTTEHIATLTGLKTNTLYYYSIGSSTQTLQGDNSNYFKTMPTAGSVSKIRFLVMGDMGNNSANQVSVRNAWQTFNGTNYTNGWLLLGDNAYSNGTDGEYQTNFFNIYQGSLTKNHVLWPAPGNHDYANNAARQADHAIPYYDMFTLPTAAQAGGVASGTEAYYSYNYGNVHFVALDSYGWETGSTRLYDTLGPQAVWLKQDLAANRMPWVVAYFHHPPYTKGSHNSDTEPELINMRQKLVPILERYKVDVVLNGHSHSYERSYPIYRHYDVDTTFVAGTHAISSTSGKYDGTPNSCVYTKSSTAARNGIIYAVVGSSGQLGGQSSGYPLNAMYYSNVTNGGALYIEVENNRLNAKWVCSDGVIRDNFTIMKNVNKTTIINQSNGITKTLSASWIGNYSWSTGSNTKSISVTPSTTSSYSVVDSFGCVKDSFRINVAKPFAISNQKLGFSVRPTIVESGRQVTIFNNTGKVLSYTIIDINGRVINTVTSAENVIINTGKFLPGTYCIQTIDSFGYSVQKFIVSR